MDDLGPHPRPSGDDPSPPEHSRRHRGGSGVSPSRPSDSSDGLLGASHQHHRHGARQLSDPQGLAVASGATGDDDAAAAATAAALEEEAKKARACEACRGLKVRCEPDPDDETQPCKRCRKAGRSCVVTAPSRKRQKKTDSRVADLEKKIDALTATLQARSGNVPGQQQQQQQQQQQHGSRGGYAPGRQAGHDDDTAAAAAAAATERHEPPWGLAPAKTWHSSTHQSFLGQDSHSHNPGGGGERRTSFGATPSSNMAGQKRKERETPGSPERLAERSQQGQPMYPAMSYKCRNPDFLERGLLELEVAEELLIRYNKMMAPHLPVILLPSGMSAAELSHTRPVLFAAIMASATSEQPVLQRTLQRELMSCLAEKVFLAGDKSMDTVQAILVAVIWYWPPENFEELKFYQLIHTASVMAIDIGLGRRVASRRAEAPFGLRDPNSKKPAPPDPLSLDGRRTWLACYLLATNVAMALHRPNLIRWTSFMAESTEVLEKSPEALPSDRYLAQLVWAHKLSEDTANQFFSEDPDVRIKLTDPATQITLRGLEREVERRRNSPLPGLNQPPTVAMTFSTVNLFMHELVLNSTGASEQDRAPFSTESLTTSMISSDTPPSSAHVSALSACLTSIHAIFDVFLAMPVDSARCLPVYFFVRVAYALVILIKMAFSAAKPGAELGRVIGADDMRLQSYLDALVEKFRETSAEDRCRPAAKFLIVLAMLRTWVARQVKDGAIAVASSSSSAGAAVTTQRQVDGSTMVSPPPPHASPSQQQQPGSTPLHLLSEVATNRNNNNNNNNNNRNHLTGSNSTSRAPPHLSGSFFNGIRHVSQPFFADSSAGATASTPSTTTSADGRGGAGSGGGMGAADMNDWIPPPTGPSSLPGFSGPAMSMDVNTAGGGAMLGLGLEGLDFSASALASEPWFDEMIQVMPNMENMWYF